MDPERKTVQLCSCVIGAITLAAKIWIAENGVPASGVLRIAVTETGNVVRAYRVIVLDSIFASQAETQYPDATMFDFTIVSSPLFGLLLGELTYAPGYEPIEEDISFDNAFANWMGFMTNGTPYRHGSSQPITAFGDPSGSAFML
jgi:hypothetical protein